MPTGLATTSDRPATPRTGYADDDFGPVTAAWRTGPVLPLCGCVTNGAATVRRRATPGLPAVDHEGEIDVPSS